MNEGNKQLDKLINCLTSVLALQSCDSLKEISRNDNPPLFKSESTMLLRNILSESLRNLFNGFDTSLIRKKPIMNVSHVASSSTFEDFKEKSSDSNKAEPFHQSAPPSPDKGLNLLLPGSILMSPIDSLNCPDPGMLVDSIPSYSAHDGIKSQINNEIPPSSVNR